MLFHRNILSILNHAEFKITTDVTSSILYNKSRQIILMGSMIPISSSELFKMEEQFAFNGEAKNLGQKREYEFLRNMAIKYLNSPYLWGGKSPFGIDCSGFIQMVFKICGYRASKRFRQQANQGKSFRDIDTKQNPATWLSLKIRKTKLTMWELCWSRIKSFMHREGSGLITSMKKESLIWKPKFIPTNFHTSDESFRIGIGRKFWKLCKFGSLSTIIKPS